MIEKMLREKKGMEKMKLLSETLSTQSISDYHQRLMGLNPGSSSYMNAGDEEYHHLAAASAAADTDHRFYWRNNNNGGCVVVDELGLTPDFQKMNINMNMGDKNNDNTNSSRQLVLEAEGFRTTSELNPNPNPSFLADPTMTRYVLANNNHHNNNCNYYNNSNKVANVNGVDPFLESSYFDHPSNNNNNNNGPMYSCNSPTSYYCNSFYPAKTSSPFVAHPLQQQQQPHCKVDPKSLSMYNTNTNTNKYGINFNSSDLIHHPKQHALNVEHATAAIYNPPPHFRPRMRADDPLAMAMRENRGLFSQSAAVLMKTAKKLDATNHAPLEDAYILQQRINRVRNCHAATPMQFHPAERICENDTSFANCHPIVLQPTLNSVSDVQGNIYLIAKDQHGCRFLQKKFEEGSYQDVELIFDEIIDRIVELMMNPFGNYLIQKLLDVCHQAQRMRIVHMVTREPGQLVRISLNTHGTRVVQKLIETLSTREQISLVVLALEPGFLDLIKDLNGNHVIQRCLQCLSTEDNKFIFDAAAKFCVDIATHRHGCCVLQRCIDHSNGEQRQKLIAEICVNGLLLAQDPFGNYVVQYILEKNIPSASAQLVTQFEEHFVHLSMQKFSSHVVEKCLKFYEESRHVIVHELLSVSHFEQVLQDQYANYVIQSALDVTKGPLHDSLVAAVRPHTILRTNPYCKKIFSRGLLKK